MFVCDLKSLLFGSLVVLMLAHHLECHRARHLPPTEQPENLPERNPSDRRLNWRCMQEKMQNVFNLDYKMSEFCCSQYFFRLHRSCRHRGPNNHPDPQPTDWPMSTMRPSKPPVPGPPRQTMRPIPSNLE